MYWKSRWYGIGFTSFYSSSMIISNSYLHRNLGGYSITTWRRKKREGVSTKSTLGHVTKGRYHVKCPQLSTRGEGVKLGQIWSTQLLNDLLTIVSSSPSEFGSWIFPPESGITLDCHQTKSWIFSLEIPRLSNQDLEPPGTNQWIRSSYLEN